jgi:hypothetical protein
MLQARRNPKAVNVTNPPWNVSHPTSLRVTVSEFQDGAQWKHKEHGIRIAVRLLEMILYRPTDVSRDFGCRKIVIWQCQLLAGG